MTTILRGPAARAFQLLGLVLLVGIGYIAVAGVGPRHSATAAPASVNQAAQAASLHVPGVHTIRAGNSGLCLTVSSTSAKTANGAKLKQQACVAGKKAQKFEIVALMDGENPFTYAIRPMWSPGWCLATNGGETNGVQIVQRMCNSGYNQMFMIICSAPGNRCYFQTRSAFNGRCLNIPGASRKSGVTVALWNCKDREKHTNMQFIIG
jgi:hypothetical protein